MLDCGGADVITAVKPPRSVFWHLLRSWSIGITRSCDGRDFISSAVVRQGRRGLEYCCHDMMASCGVMPAELLIAKKKKRGL